MRFLFPALLGISVLASTVSAIETESVKYPGLKALQVGTEVNAIRPGETLLIGLHFSHEADYHTYWKSPGVVGVPAIVEWQEELPKGFEVGDYLWPAPQNTLMATLNAWGYETDTTILIPVKVPKDLNGKKEVTFKGRIGWMCCATSCHPGWHDFSLTLPVAKKGETVSIDEKWQKRFDDSRGRFPQAAPEGWTFKAEAINQGRIRLIVHAPSGAKEIDWSKVYFFCDDNQVASDAKQKVTPLSGEQGAVLTFSRPDFAPKNPACLSGVLMNEEGWPALEGHPSMIASASWPEYEEPSSDGEEE